VAFRFYVTLYRPHAIVGAGDFKLKAAVGSIVGWKTGLHFHPHGRDGGVMSLILVTVKGRMKKTLVNFGLLLRRMRSGGPRI